MPVAAPPFFAAPVWPIVSNTQGGPAHDARQRVLDAFGAPIPGLYAVGADMHSVMGGVYTAPGITLGPGIVFGYIAGRHAASRAAAAAGRI